jgi:hypothetical protein
VLGLKWEDTDFVSLTANVFRSVADGHVEHCKTETSQQPAPRDELTRSELLRWRMVAPYCANSDWIFASGTLWGRMPIWANTSREKILQRVARKVGITKSIGWHTFRHTYSSLLAESGNDVKVMQELMRHAKVATMMEIYTHARMERKRAAQKRVVDVLFKREWTGTAQAGLNVALTCPRCVQKVRVELRKCLGEIWWARGDSNPRPLLCQISSPSEIERHPRSPSSMERQCSCGAGASFVPLTCARATLSKLMRDGQG